MRFHEVQRVHEWWVWLIVVGTGLPFVLGAWLSIRAYRKTMGGARWILLAAGIVSGLTALGPAAFLVALSMTTDVRGDGVHVSIAPFLHDEVVPYVRVERLYVRKYDPIGEYGGWGIRFGGSGRALNMSGDRGVQLVLAGNRPLLIGSQRPDELADAIERHRPGRVADLQSTDDWTRIDRPALLELQCRVSLRRSGAALEEAERLERSEHLAPTDRMWLGIYRGIALDQQGRRDEAVRAFRDAAAIHPHGVAVDGTLRPIVDLRHLRRMQPFCESHRPDPG